MRNTGQLGRIIINTNTQNSVGRMKAKFAYITKGDNAEYHLTGSVFGCARGNGG